MELRHLKYFVAVAEELNFSRAAERLGIAQPPLSQQIRRLEDELGVPLFLRTRRRVELTDTGRAILAEARAALAQAERIANLARRAAAGEAGVLRLGFSSSALYTVLPEILRAFRARAPAVTLSLLERTSEEQVHLLAAGALDAGFIRLPIESAAPSLAVRSVLREPLLAALVRDHRLSRAGAVAVRALEREPFIMVARQAAPGLHDQIIALCAHGGFRPTIAHEAAELSTIIGLVSAGLGVAIVPSSARTLSPGRVTYRALKPAGSMTEMAVAYEKGNRSRVLANFLDLVAKVSAR
jgi:DNA-binding transcriptional LysR family regulator